MDPKKLFFDKRLTSGCAYCGDSPSTRDHVPSKVLLDEPFPSNLPIVQSCEKCNSGFSLDEEYLACFIECVISGTVDAEKIERQKIRRILKNKPSLAQAISNNVQIGENGEKLWHPDMSRVRNVILKLARGHTIYDCSEQRDDEPERVFIKPFCTMTDAEAQEFEHIPATAVWPEIGSRAFVRAAGISSDPFFRNGWQVIQDNRYRYLVDYSGPLTVKIVLREYLACEISW